MINFEILLPNKNPFQIENHVQRTHLCVLCIYGKRRSKNFGSKFFPLIFLDRLMENSRKCIISGPLNPARGKCGQDKTNHSKKKKTEVVT
jgi:hypothetical protein